MIRAWSCESCRFWVPLGDGHVGICRGGPPTAMTDTSSLPSGHTDEVGPARWPVTKFDDYCAVQRPGIGEGRKMKEGG